MTQSVQGWAALVLADRGSVFLVGLTDQVLKAGEVLVDPARLRAKESSTADAEASDILAGNGYLALMAEDPDRASAAACLGGIAAHTESRAFVVSVRRHGGALDCTLTHLGEGRADVDSLYQAVTAQAAQETGMAMHRLQPGRLIAAD